MIISRIADPVYVLGSLYYFMPATLEVGNEAGLDALRFYVLGRGGVLGDVEAPVVVSAFGYFEPAMLSAMWNSACEVMAPRDAARLHLRCAHAYGRDRLGGVANLDTFCAAAEAVIAAADPAGLALFAGYSAEPLPDDLPARAMQLVVTLRELRGSVHLLAVVASGLSPRTAHYLRRPNDFGLFGWSDTDIPEVSDADRRALEEADRCTDRLLEGPFGVLDGTRSTALAEVIEAMAVAAVAPI